MPTEKYTPEQEKLVTELYSQNIPVEEIATQINKSVRSVIAKLSRLQVYKSKQPKEVRLTKMQLVDKLEDLTNLGCGTLHSLEKADRDALVALLATVEGQRNIHLNCTLNRCIINT